MRADERGDGPKAGSGAPAAERRAARLTALPDGRTLGWVAFDARREVARTRVAASAREAAHGADEEATNGRPGGEEEHGHAGHAVVPCLVAVAEADPRFERWWPGAACLSCGRFLGPFDPYPRGDGGDDGGDAEPGTGRDREASAAALGVAALLATDALAVAAFVPESGLLTLREWRRALGSEEGPGRQDAERRDPREAREGSGPA